jgi:hypothetical protein
MAPLKATTNEKESTIQRLGWSMWWRGFYTESRLMIHSRLPIPGARV